MRTIDAALEELGLEGPRCSIEPVAGGDIHRAWRVTTPTGEPLFVKTNDRPPPGIFESEARGLAALRTAAADDGGLIQVPQVRGVGSSWLALEWVELSGSKGSSIGRALGEGLAALHRHSSASFGWTEDNWIGRLPQPNAPASPGDDAGIFFADRRLRVQAELGRSRLPSSLLERVERFCARIGEFLPAGEEQPALLHGDLWGGNWGADGSGAAWIFDPAAHYGCREAELAFTRLFGGFPPSFHEAYEASFPLLDGFSERVELWNLYHLLTHANMFGGGYASRAEAILRTRVG